MAKQIISPLLIVGLFSPIATKAEVYNALCDVSQSTSSKDDSSIEVFDCQITLSEEGFSGPTDFIPKDSISQWYSLRQEDNLLYGLAGAAGGTYTGAAGSALQYMLQVKEYCVYQLYLGACMEAEDWDLKRGKEKNFLFSVIAKILSEALLLKILQRLKGKLTRNLKSN